MEENLEVARRKFTCLKEQNEGFLVTEKLQQELEEYREIIKCSICQDRAKEVFLCTVRYYMCVSQKMLVKMQLDAEGISLEVWISWQR